MPDNVLPIDELLEALNCDRRDGKKIVTTNGIFDVLHVGHARYLKAARALGDVLVVCINTDACTKKLKGETRPFVPELERAELVSSLACVTYVTLFDDLTPVNLLSLLEPDIHVKGGDYQIERMPETEVVRRNGGEVVLIQFEEGHSTTGLAERIAASLSGT